MADYNIPFGADASQFLTGVSQMEEGVDKLSETVETAGEEMQKSFDESARSGANLNKSINENVIAAKKFEAEVQSGVAPNLEKLKTLSLALAGNMEMVRIKMLAAVDPKVIEGFKRQAVEIEKASLALNKLKPAAAGAGAPLQDLSRIVQDLPFGFVGIQNNISPLFESFSRLVRQTGSVGGGISSP